MSNNFAKDLVVLGATVASTLITCIVLSFIDLSTSFSVYGLTLWFVLPVGAFLAGFAGMSGCYIAARVLNHKPTWLILIGVLLLSAATFFIINYLDYYFTSVEGLQLRSVISFGTYLKVTLSNLSVCFRICTGSNSSLGLGSAGYIAAGLQVVGFFVGGASLYGVLASQRYCDSCARYYSHVRVETRYFPDSATALSAYNNELQLLQERHFHEALTDCTVAGDGHKKTHTNAMELRIQRCTNCLRHHLVLQLNVRQKKDWNSVSASRREFDTDTMFYPPAR